MHRTRRLRDDEDDDGKMRLRSGQSSGETVREIISYARCRGSAGGGGGGDRACVHVGPIGVVWRLQLRFFIPFSFISQTEDAMRRGEETRGLTNSVLST